MPTFVFTDIESSTRLWEEHPQEMAKALELHDAIVTRAILDTGGKVLKTTGDGFIAVYESAGPALSAALMAQSRLANEPWGPIGELRVRIGVHAGEAEDRDGDLFGPAMNRTARIMAAAHGGQVIMSESVARSTMDMLPSQASLRDLGTHRLKDLTSPEHLFQLVHPDVRTDFPAPSTLDSRPNNLPLQTTEFVGRAEEMAAILALLESPNTRLLTIAGPGGAGKTRLALNVAAELIDGFSDGVYFVDLAAERDPESAYETIVRTLGLPVSPDGGPLETLKSRLRDRNMLVVLDNFEQVTSAATGVADVLQSAPELVIVVTSRETLRVRAERVFPVPPLSLPHPGEDASSIAESEAVQLFIDRARAARAGFSLDPETAPLVAEICLRLDGLPLAIELAAARLNVFTPADLLGRLRTRLDVLGAGGRDLPDRQRTLWGAIGWSYELLNEHECALFELMSVFSPTSLAAIETVAAAALGPRMIVDDLSSLVDKSLVRSIEGEPGQRFSMLLMIKEYAIERLDESPERSEAVRHAHARYFSDLSLRLQGRIESVERDAALEDLNADIGNLRTAWRYWVDNDDAEELLNLIGGLWALHDAKGWYHAAIELANDALEVLGRAKTSSLHAAEELTIRTSLARALMAVRGYGVEVEAEFKRVLAMSEKNEAAATRFPVLRALASYYMNSADFVQSAEYGRRILALGERENDEAILIEGHYTIGASVSFSGDLETGLPHLEQAIQMYDHRRHLASHYRLGPNVGVVARTASGLLLWQCGRLADGVIRLTEALELARAIQHPFSIAYALYHNGFLALWRNRADETVTFANELRAVASENQYVLWGTLATFLEGVSKAGLGQVEEGLAMTETAIELYQGLTTPPVFWPLVLALRSQVHAAAGDLERAFQLIEEAITIAGPDELVPPQFRIMRGDYLRSQGEAYLEEAEESYKAAVEGSKAAGFRTIELEALIRLVGLSDQFSRLPDRRPDLAQSLEWFGQRDREESPVTLARALIEAN